MRYYAKVVRPAENRRIWGTMADSAHPAYLDHAATTPMLPEAVEAMTAQLAVTGNASSLHAAGRRARRTVEEARETLAEALGARPSEVVFTSRRHRGRQPRRQGPVLGPPRRRPGRHAGSWPAPSSTTPSSTP